MAEDSHETSETPTPAEAPPRKGRSRMSLRLSMALQIIFMALIVIGANVISCQEYGRKDLTLGGTYELSELTERLLDSDLIRDREKPVKIIIAHRRQSPLFTRLATLAEEYRRLGDGKIEVELIDPQRQPDRAVEIAEQYRREFDDDIVIVDARTGDLPVFEEVDLLPSEARDGANTRLELSAHVRFIESGDLALYQQNNATGRELVAWRDEDAISTAILSTAEGDFRRIYLIADKSDIVNPTDPGPWQQLTTLFYNQNIALLPVRISEIEKIPLDADGVAIVAPRFDFDKREIAVLRNYWMQPNSSIALMLSPEHRLPNLSTFMREFGVMMRDDRVITERRGEIISSVRGTFVAGPDINRSLVGKSTEFAGVSSSLEVRESAPDLLNKRVQPIVLFEAAQDYWGEVDYTAAERAFDPDRDNNAPLATAAAVIRGNASDDELADEISRMFIIANADFLSPEQLREENVDFVRSGAQWMMGKEQFIGVGPRNIITRRLSLTAADTTFINRVTLFFMPAIAFAIGAFVWNLRRR